MSDEPKMCATEIGPNDKLCVIYDDDCIPLAMAVFNRNGFVATELWHPKDVPLDLETCATLVTTAARGLAEAHNVPMDDLMELAKEYLMNPKKHMPNRRNLNPEN